MSLSVGIIGLPNVGKSTLFNALTTANVNTSPYPFCTISPNIGIVEVKDERLDKLHQISKLPQKTYATIKFIDIAGLVKNAHKGEGLGNQFLSHIREVDLVVHLVRNFEDVSISHTEGSINSIRDIEIVNFELILADLQTVIKRIEKINPYARSGNLSAKKELEILQKIKEALEKEIEIRNIQFENDELEIVLNYNFLTNKKVIYLINISEENINKEDEKINSYVKSKKGEIIYICVKLEQELSELPEKERKDYLIELGLKESVLDKLVKLCYKSLNLITFFTIVGEKEARAWSITKGTKAIDAAGKIHKDIKDGFIKAEIISYNDFVKIENFNLAREKGLLKIESKDYIVCDGDIINFKFR